MEIERGAGDREGGRGVGLLTGPHGTIRPAGSKLEQNQNQEQKQSNSS